MKRQIEILAPAGSYESMKAAMNAGCDAVYIGGSSFGARAYANNLEEEALLHAINEAHIRDKRLYLTVNTLIKEQEREEKLYHFLEKFYHAGLDAVIVQDVGVMHFIHRHFPKLPIHASTQTTLTMAQGAELLRDTGVTRIVTARELSLKEIRTIRDNTNLEIETFVHGALCYCYSGQCLMSSMIGGRSGNRGRCAQPCRMPYQFYSGDSKISSEKERYLLSPKDINTTALIPELIEAGIDSFKIEGRMKRPEYTAGVSAMYRKYVDYYLEYGNDKFRAYLNSSSYQQEMNELQDLYNRGGFSQGYGNTYHGKSMMSLIRPNHSGVYVGDVTGRNGSQVSIQLKEKINAQDILEIRYQEEESGYEFTVKDSAEKGDTIKTNVGNIPFDKTKSKLSGQNIRTGSKVYRTKNNELLNKIASEYMDTDRKQGVKAVLKAKLDERLELTLSYKNIDVTAYQGIVQAAVKQPVSQDKIATSIEKFGDTPYYLEELKIDTWGDIFVPVAWLNEIRREAVQLLQEAVLTTYRRAPVFHDATNSPLEKEKRDDSIEITQEEFSNQSEEKPMGICVTVRTKEQFQTALGFSEISAIYADYDGFALEELLRMAEKSKKVGKSFYPALPHICRLSVYEKLKKEMALLLEDNNITGFIAKNFEEISLLQSSNVTGRQFDIRLNYNLYIFNKEAKEFYRELGINHFTAPIEQNAKELKRLGVSDSDLIVYGYLPLMVSAQCLHESTVGCKRCKEGEQRMDYLTDRLGKKFYVQTNCNGCYNIIYNGQCLSLLKHAKEICSMKPRNIRLDFTMETGEETNRILTAFIDVFRRNKAAGLIAANLTTGHFKRGVE